MADTYEQNLGQKSSLTTSDFIRVVGSDNVSYKQGVSTVASVINSAQPIETHSGSIKQWALQRNGQAIICTSPTRTTDLPGISNKYGVAWTKSYVGDTNIGDTNKWVNLYWSPTNTSDIYICSNMSNIDSWTAWQKMPTRAEIDELNNNRGKITEVITLNNGLSAIGICQQLSSLMDANTGFQCQVFSSGRRYVCGYQYGPKSYGAFLVMTYTGILEFVWNNNGTWGSRNL